MVRSHALYFVVSPSELGYVKFILESYEGLVTMHTLDGKKGLVEILIPPADTDAYALLEALASEVALHAVTPPEGYPSLLDLCGETA